MVPYKEIKINNFYSISKSNLNLSCRLGKKSKKHNKKLTNTNETILKMKKVIWDHLEIV